MGRPLRKLHQADVREKIRTSQLINRLQNHALGKVKLSTTQIRAIECLLRKTIPDLQSIEMAATVGVETHDERVKRWQEQYGARG